MVGNFLINSVLGESSSGRNHACLATHCTASRTRNQGGEKSWKPPANRCTVRVGLLLFEKLLDGSCRAIQYAVLWRCRNVCGVQGLGLLPFEANCGNTSLTWLVEKHGEALFCLGSRSEQWQLQVREKQRAVLEAALAKQSNAQSASGAREFCELGI